jgi:Lon protease-like protein
MGPEGALGRARQELLASLARLPAGVSFQVILYNRQCEPLRIGGRSGFLPADQPTREALARELDRIAAAGNTDHFRALQTGLRLGADVLYLVTDSDDLSDHDVQALTRQNGGRTAIHAIELNRRRADADGPLQRLATQNGGTFRQVPPVE